MSQHHDHDTIIVRQGSDDEPLRQLAIDLLRMIAFAACGIAIVAAVAVGLYYLPSLK